MTWFLQDRKVVLKSNIHAADVKLGYTTMLDDDAPTHEQRGVGPRTLPLAAGRSPHELEADSGEEITSRADLHTASC